MRFDFNIYKDSLTMLNVVILCICVVVGLVLHEWTRGR
mgnify:FL=1